MIKERDDIWYLHAHNELWCNDSDPIVNAWWYTITGMMYIYVYLCMPDFLRAPKIVHKIEAVVFWSKIHYKATLFHRHLWIFSVSGTQN